MKLILRFKQHFDIGKSINLYTILKEVKFVNLSSKRDI